MAASRGEDGQPPHEAENVPEWPEGEEVAIARNGGVSTPEDIEEDIQSQDSFETATSQGHRTEEDDAQEFSISMVNLGG